jgi:hypothetical protein
MGLFDKLLQLLFAQKQLQMQSGRDYSDEYSLPKPPDYETDPKVTDFDPLPGRPGIPDEQEYRRPRPPMWQEPEPGPEIPEKYLRRMLTPPEKI